jgi:hypothetical protein
LVALAAAGVVEAPRAGLGGDPPQAASVMAEPKSTAAVRRRIIGPQR